MLPFFMPSDCLSNNKTNGFMFSGIQKAAGVGLTVVLAIACCLCAPGAVYAASTRLVDEKPVSITKDPSGVIIVDFGRVAFGNIRLMPPEGMKGSVTVTVHFGEAFKDGRIDRHPPGTVRYSKAVVELNGSRPVTAAPPADSRNTEIHSGKHPPAILTPPEWGVVLPFRWVEIEGWPGPLRREQIIRQAAFSATWDDKAASFESSDDMLNRIWELCRYTIKATTFAGVYVDGDRERIPYEADAYLTQLSHYYTDTDKQMARDTFDHLMTYSTWPTEWAPHMVFMAYADWMHTGDLEWLAARYEALKKKLLFERAGEDGLITSTPQQIKKGDLVDWPKKERDGYVLTSCNTVVNAFHLRALKLMAELARVTGHHADARAFENRLKSTKVRFQQQFFNPETGLYVDGKGTKHSSLHANLFPLAFGLVPEAHRENITSWLVQRGMRCSVYAAQYLIEALFENGAGTQAIELITAPNDRSWRHMVESGTTLTWEAWDMKYKPNMDWNHAWGAAPANLLPRFILGVQPLEPGWKTARIVPSIANLKFAKGKVPTPRGPIFIDWQRDDTLFSISITLPDGMLAKVELPAMEGTTGVHQADRPVKARKIRRRWVLDVPVSGRTEFEVR